MLQTKDTDKFLKLLAAVSLLALIAFVLIDAKSDSTAIKLLKYASAILMIVLTTFFGIRKKARKSS
ncbi:MAG TPA: hypothetical protein DIW54_12470 [Chitinophagaceae bacterium]|nr:hypothetical protein [Chitinophagaceae bacterium]HCT24083.1 hypothetical protein [Chitinophagaceae bacterium]